MQPDDTRAAGVEASGLTSPPSGDLPRVSVIIPAFGRTALLRECLLALFRQDLNPNEYEILVVDSTRGDCNQQLVAALNRESPSRLRYLWKAPEGPGPSRNLGFANALGSVIAFIDSDCKPSPAWLREGLARFETGVGLVQGRTLPDPMAKRGVFCHYLSVEQESYFYETANIFYRREALAASGGFQADLTPNAPTPMGSEDTEVAWNVIRRGWKTRFCPEAVVYHAVFPLGPWQWLFIRRLFCIPRLTKQFPELRQFMVCAYFFDLGQALFALTLTGILLTPLNPLALLLGLPYAVFRASEPTRSLGGLLRPIRVGPYFARDVFSFFILSAGSLRYRSLVL